MKQHSWRAHVAILICMMLGLVTVPSKAQEDSIQAKAVLESRIRAKYAIVGSEGKYGIYDQEKQQFVTEPDMDYIQYSHYAIPEEDLCFCYYYFERGYMYGKIGINMQDNTKMEISMENPEYVARLDRCTTVDRQLQTTCRQILAQTMEEADGQYGQLAVLEAKSARLLSWAAIRKDSTGCEDAPLLKDFCSIGYLKPVIAVKYLHDAGLGLHDTAGDGQNASTYKEAYLSGSDSLLLPVIELAREGRETWRQLTKSLSGSNAMVWAAMFNCFYHRPVMEIPTLEADSVEIHEDFCLDDRIRADFRELADGMVGEGGLAGFCDRMVSGSGDGKEELSLVGCYPADDPRYVVCLVIHRPVQDPAIPSTIVRTINMLVSRLKQE